MREKENIYLLMEETGCDEGQAELVLQSCGQSMEKAIKTIYSLLKHIIVIKGKFMCPQQNLYGLFVIIGNTRNQIVIRQAAIVSCDPSVYEKDLASRWHLFEKDLYVLRLCDGSIQELSHKLEQHIGFNILEERNKYFFDSLKEGNIDVIKTLMKDIIENVIGSSIEKTELEMNELSLDQFRGLRDETSSPEPDQSTVNGKKGDKIVLDIQPVLDRSKKCIPVDRLKKDNAILVKIVDQRDIAYYISHLIGGRKEDQVIPFSSLVSDLTESDGIFSLTTRLSPGILGRSFIRKGSLVTVIKRSFRWKTHMLVSGLAVLAVLSVLALVYFL